MPLNVKLKFRERLTKACERFKARGYPAVVTRKQRSGVANAAVKVYDRVTLRSSPSPGFDLPRQSIPEREQAIMIGKRMAVTGILAAFAMLLFLPNPAPAAEDGAALFKAKCAPCHGADATGKPAVKAPSLVSEEAKKLTDDELTDAIANGGKEKKASHAFSKKGVTPEQVKALISYIRELQKK
jgi:mono/diheme cytochrome c family protein